MNSVRIFILIAVLFSFIVFAGSIQAQSPTPTPLRVPHQQQQRENSLLWVLDGFGLVQALPPLPSEIAITLPCDVTMELVLIPEGKFNMGQPTWAGRISPLHQSPQHEVHIAYNYYMGKYEVTKAQWQAVMGTSPWLRQKEVLDDPNSPAVYISWNDTQAFIQALNNLGQGVFRLPTEAEWEYACRAGTTTSFYWGNDPGNTLAGDYAWYRSNTSDNLYAHPVGLKLPNAWGLYDMIGNVWEYCEDSYSTSYVNSLGDGSAWVIYPRSSPRIMRGGSWSGAVVGSDDRTGSWPFSRVSLQGFRVVMNQRNLIVPPPSATPTPTIRVTPTPSLTPNPAIEELTIHLPGNVPLVLVRIPAGSFIMGSPESEVNRFSHEEPQHRVNIDYDFYMGKYEITQAQWQVLMNTNPAKDLGVGPNHPVYYVSWRDCREFLIRLNAHVLNTNQGPAIFRLPNEAEWEYACRAGTETRFYFGDSLSCGDGASDCSAGVLPGRRSDYMWYAGNMILERAQPVGQKAPNAFGLYDMHGNVAEWCHDDYSTNYASAPGDGSAWVHPQGAYDRIMRGGFWYANARSCRSAHRGWGFEHTRFSSCGLRVARHR